MPFIGFPVLSGLILFPILGGLGLFFLKKPQSVRLFALAVSLGEMVLGLPLLGFKPDGAEFQFVESVSWVAAWDLQYSVGVDGISLLMVGLTLIMLPVCVLCSWTSVQKRVKEFHFCLLFCGAVCIGVFSALDLVLFYLFYEAILIPVYLMIVLWGGEERERAALKFILYTLAGSALLLVAVIAFRISGETFSIPLLMKHSFPYEFQRWVFAAMALAFAVKTPLFPFHTWLPAAYVQAPTAGTVLLSAVLAKMGAYGFLRFCIPLTPSASDFFAPLLIAMSIASILYGGIVALAQTNIKRIIAYSSLAHIGFVVLGIFLLNAKGAQGALLQMVNHGITTGALFVMVGILHARSGSAALAENQGLGKYLPAFMGFWGFLAFAGFGFPGTGNFVGEFLVLTGAFERSLWVGALTIPGALLAAAYMLRPTRNMAWGEPSRVENWNDLNGREWACLLPLAFLVLYLGLAPSLVLKTMNPSLERMLNDFGERQTRIVLVSKTEQLKGFRVQCSGFREEHRQELERAFSIRRMETGKTDMYENSGH